MDKKVTNIIKRFLQIILLPFCLIPMVIDTLLFIPRYIFLGRWEYYFSDKYNKLIFQTLNPPTT